MLIREFKKQDADIVLQNADKFTVAFELELAFDAQEMNLVEDGLGTGLLDKLYADDENWSILDVAEELFTKLFPSLVPYIPHLNFDGDGSIQGVGLRRSETIPGFGIEITPKLYFKLLENDKLSSFDFLEKFYNEYPKQKVFVLNKSCGFHVNIGFEGKKGEQFNSALAFLLVNHKFSNILAPDRENNSYAKDIRTTPVDAEGSDSESQKLVLSVKNFARKESGLSTEEKLIGIFDIIKRYLEASESHYNGFSVEKLQDSNYIEFRFPGGDFVSNNSLEKIKNTILYYCHIIYRGFFGKPDASTIKKALAFYEKLKHELVGPPNTGKINKITNTLQDGSKTTFYIKDGKFHRRNGPAEITVGPDGKVTREIYSIDGVRHRENGPAYIFYNKDGTLERTSYYLYGDIDRLDDEPSQYFYDSVGNLEGVKYFKKGAIHRDVGPAIIKLRNGKPVTELYYINNREVTKEEQEKWATVRGLMAENSTKKELQKLVMETVNSVYDEREGAKVVTLPQDRRLITESFLTMWGHGIRKALEKMFDIPVYENVTFRGRRTDVEALYRTLAAEKRYIDAFIDNGLSDPRVTSSKYELEKAIYTFESQTGIKWPII